VRAVEETEEVDLDHRPPLAGVGALHGPEQHHPSVVDQAVEAAHRLRRGLDEPSRRGLLGDVDLERVG
jgi:hypothetical protein